MTMVILMMVYSVFVVSESLFSLPLSRRERCLCILQLQTLLASELSADAGQSMVPAV